MFVAAELIRKRGAIFARCFSPNKFSQNHKNINLCDLILRMRNSRTTLISHATAEDKM